MATLQGKAAITALATGDHLTVHDASSTAEDAAGDLKKITYANLITELTGEAGIGAITSGSGAPASTPANVGDVYIDTAARTPYIATGTSSSADWDEHLTSASGSTLTATATVDADSVPFFDDSDSDNPKQRTWSNIKTDLALAILGANTFTGTQDFNGQQVEAHLTKVVASATGTLTTTAHSGNLCETSGNVTIPTTAGFNCVLLAGGAHTVTFNATTSAAMATGDLMTLVVEDATTIHAVLTASADKVTFS